MNPFSIVWITSRVNCRVEWFCDSLAKWAADDLDDIQVVFVDRHLWSLTPEAGNTYFRRGDLISLTDERWMVESRVEKFERAVGGRFNYLHVPPMPGPVNGPFRLTAKDWFAASQSRNSGIVCAKHKSLVFCDDLSCLLPSWYSNARYAASSPNAVTCGSYWKQKDLVVTNGEVSSYTEYPGGRDTRWMRGSDTGIVPWTGRGLFGCSFVCPLELMLRVNGCDPACDMNGGEDFDLGIRLERAGAEVWYNRNLQSWESEEGHHSEPSLPRERKIVTADNLPSGYDQYPHANAAEKYYSDHVLLNRVVCENRIIPSVPWAPNLRQARDEFQASQRVLIPTGPTLDWRDGTDLKLL